MKKYYKVIYEVFVEFEDLGKDSLNREEARIEAFREVKTKGKITPVIIEESAE